MNLLRLIQIAKVVSLLSAAFLALAVGTVAIKVGNSISGVATQANVTLGNINTEIKAVDITRKSLDDLMVQTTVLIIDADNAATKEVSVLDSVNTQVTTTLGHVDESVQALTKNQNELTLHTVQTLDASTETVNHLQGVLDQSKTLLIASQGTLTGLDKVIADPSIPATFKSVATASQATAGSMQHVEHMTTDADTALHSYLNPTWKVKVATWTLKVIHALNPYAP